jgi:hypothetical protein
VKKNVTPSEHHKKLLGKPVQRGRTISPLDRVCDNPATPISSPLEVLTRLVSKIDEHIESLRRRHASVVRELDDLIAEENRVLREFADADHDGRKNLDKTLSALTQKRTTLERESRALQLAIAETDQERQKVYPELERLRLEAQHAERSKKLDELRRAHEQDQQKVSACDRALADAMEKANRSYFALRAAVDQQAVDEQLVATERLKDEWQRNGGPNAGSRQTQLGGQ